MDNYFAKFLCKHPKAISTIHNPLEENEKTSPSVGGNVKDSLPCVNPIHPYFSSNEEKLKNSALPQHGDSINLHKSFPTAASFVEGSVARESDPSLGDPIRSPTFRSVSSYCRSASSTPTPLKEERTFPNEKGENGPTPQRRRVEVPSLEISISPDMGAVKPPKSFDDDDDDLFLLLGSQEARRQIEKKKTVDVRANKVVSPSSSSFPLSSTPFTPRLVRDFPWNSSRSDLQKIARCFALQLEVEMTSDSTLFAVFSPFLKKRFLEKVERSRREHLVCSPSSTSSPSPLSWFPHPMELPEDSWVNGSEEYASNPYREVIASQSIIEPPPKMLPLDVVNPLPSSSSLSLETDPTGNEKKEVKIDINPSQASDSRSPSQHFTPSSGGAERAQFSLRSYQVEGVKYLLDHFHRGLSCVLSDDMGLGKTAQVSSFLHVLWRLHSIPGPHLIICPLSTITNWVRELNRWAPALKVMKYHGNRKDRSRQKYSCDPSSDYSTHRHHFGVVVTTPAIFNQDKGFFLHRTWVVVAVDEAHVLKNSNSRITSLSRKLTACFRLAVTGTPIQNNIQEVFSILGFLFPSITVMEGNFEDDDPATAVTACTKILSHLMLRRTKSQLLLGLPPRIDHPVTMLEPTFVQQELLRLMCRGALEDRDAFLQGHLTHQRMVCSHPLSLRLTAKTSSTTHFEHHLSLHNGSGAFSFNENLTAPTESESKGNHSSSSSIIQRLTSAGISLQEQSIIHCSAKMRYLDSVLPRLQKDGHRCLIFTNFTSVLDLLEGFCVLRGYSYERLDGSCSRVERELSLLRFNNVSSSCFLFLITTSAGGVGITLTGADTVILLDANFNPQLDRQAADRAHRIGQTREVHVYRLCLSNTLEEYIHEVSEYKASLGDMIVVHASGGTIGRVTGTDTCDASKATTTTVNSTSTSSTASNLDPDSTTVSRSSSSPTTSSATSFPSSGSVNFNLSGVEIRRFLESHQQRSRKRFEECAAAHLSALPSSSGSSAIWKAERNSEEEKVLADTRSRPLLIGENDDSDARPFCDAVLTESDEENTAFTMDRALIEELLSLERESDKDVGMHFGGSRRQADDGGTSVSRLSPRVQANICFVCDERMHKMEPLYHCTICPKAYHAECVGERKPLPGHGLPQRHWTCPRHRCFTCDKAAASSDGAIFMCYSCPRAYCFDCLPSFFLELEEKGEELRYVHKTYEGMKEEGVPVRTWCYYLQCHRCSNMEQDSSSSSSEVSSGASDEEEDATDVEELECE